MRRALRSLALAVTLGLTAAAPALSENRREVSVFAGLLTDNPWEEVVFTPWKAEFQDPGLLGVAAAFGILAPLQTRLGEVTFWIEPQVVRHFDLQQHWEFNLPIAARLQPNRRVLGFIDTVAFGIGPSYATSPPPLERRRGEGEVNRALIHWHIDLSHRLAAAKESSLFLRLHHRSNGYGLVGSGGSSNGLVIGLRTAF